MNRRPPRPRRALSGLLGFALAAATLAALWVPVEAKAQATPSNPPLGAVRLPKEWQDRFWGGPQAQALLKLSPKELADLVPVQSGLKFCACPACGEPERNDPLAWSIEQPKVVECRKCKGTFPSPAFPVPNKADGLVPTEKVEVLPNVWHAYPYHVVVLEKAGYADERLYLDAKRDYEARAFLSKAALYAAVRWSESKPAERDPKLAQAAAALILRFAQVYPKYAMHNDQPGIAKQLLPARVPPPYRRGFQTGKWEWNGSLETPMNLLLAYSLLRDGADWPEAGRLLECDDPKRTIEEDLFVASAELSSRQPDDYTEDSLHVYRGLLSVGRLVGSDAMVREALARIDEFTRRGFYHDGFWRSGDVLGHRRVLGLLDGWIDGLAGAGADKGVVGKSTLPLIDLARVAGAAVPSRPPDQDVQRVSWPVEASYQASRRPMLLGGAGLALLSAGEGPHSLDVELRGPDGLTDRRSPRLAFRLSAGGVPLIDDLDERPPTANGWDLATASHNTVVVDGLNQRETPQAARIPTPGSDFKFFAADPDFQVVTAADRFAYPISTSRYRQTFLLSRSAERTYAVSIFEVDGGLQHDQIFHAAPGRKEAWRPHSASSPAAGSLLPPSITFLPEARPEEGRWFVQAYGEFRPRLQAAVSGPTQVSLGGPSPAAPLKLHLLGDMPATLVTADSADVSAAGAEAAQAASSRSGLIVRRRTEDGGNLASVFVTVFEPMVPGLAPLDRVGRVESIGEAVVVLVESPEGSEHLVFNRTAGTPVRVQLANGRYVATDGLAVRVRGDDVVLAGGSFVEAAGRLVSHKGLRGTITAATRESSERGRGWFLTPGKLPEDLAVAGRTLFVEHGDGSSRSWTLDSIEATPEGTRLHVREEPGFRIDVATGAAEYYQYPLTTSPGPHRFRLAQMSRSPASGAGTIPKPSPPAASARRLAPMRRAAAN
ncbi:hypothetical protein [Planctomyces sp. SH-PL62]|uniref:hypothetical protein n=1 Tax=Planctomyces sp. SH-PL62 TaxID=1636152 RepID=UPI00078EE0D8|nr:hypothetical protein [Planctomyces sp. SH-PL62]AMV36745.1 hypothetical protein VT85_04895 [Planctomyces sp. SH-PL62]